MKNRQVQITVKEKVWKELNQQREAGETMSDVIERNIRNIKK